MPFLEEEGIEVVLLNSNPAAIMTDKDIADKVYVEPLTVEVVEQLILKKAGQRQLPTLGDQAGLNLAMGAGREDLQRASCAPYRNNFPDHQKGGGSPNWIRII